MLKVSNSLALGIKNTATFFSKGKLKTLRFRHPRHITTNAPMSTYDESFAEVQAILRKFSKITSSKLVFFTDFRFAYDIYANEISSIILTDKNILCVYNGKEVIFDIDITKLTKTEVHLNKKQDKFLIVFFYNKNDKEFILTENLSICCQIYSLLSK